MKSSRLMVPMKQNNLLYSQNHCISSQIVIVPAIKMNPHAFCNLCPIHLQVIIVISLYFPVMFNQNATMRFLNTQKSRYSSRQTKVIVLARSIHYTRHSLKRICVQHDNFIKHRTLEIHLAIIKHHIEARYQKIMYITKNWHHHRGLCRLSRWIFGAAISTASSGGGPAIPVGPAAVAACPVFLKHRIFVTFIVIHLRLQSTITCSIKSIYNQQCIHYETRTHRISHTYIQLMAIGHINRIATAYLLDFSTLDCNLPPDLTFRALTRLIVGLHPLNISFSHLSDLLLLELNAHVFNCLDRNLFYLSIPEFKITGMMGCILYIVNSISNIKSMCFSMTKTVKNVSLVVSNTLTTHLIFLVYFQQMFQKMQAKVLSCGGASLENQFHPLGPDARPAICRKVVRTRSLHNNNAVFSAKTYGGEYSHENQFSHPSSRETLPAICIKAVRTRIHRSYDNNTLLSSNRSEDDLPNCIKVYRHQLGISHKTRRVINSTTAIPCIRDNTNSKALFKIPTPHRSSISTFFQLINNTTALSCIRDKTNSKALWKTPTTQHSSICTFFTSAKRFTTSSDHHTCRKIRI